MSTYKIGIRDYCDYFYEIEADSWEEARTEAQKRFDQLTYDEVKEGEPKIQMLHLTNP